MGNNNFREIVEQFPNYNVNDYLRRYLAYHGDTIKMSDMLEWIETIEWFLKKRIEAMEVVK